MHPVEVLNDPVRRRLVELLATQDQNAGELTRVVMSEFGIRQPAVSRHLRVLREADVVHSEVRAQRRLYRLNEEALRQMEDLVAHYSALWTRRLDALDAHLAQSSETSTDRRKT